MSRLRSRAHAVAVIVAVVLLVAGGLAPRAAAAGPDRSDVVLVLDFSASILQDATNRNRFGAALERIADRVDETAATLVSGDVTVSIVQFATRAADYPSCVDLKLLNSQPAVTRFANCLRSVAAAYRTGTVAALTKRVGTDTNYVAAMERAATHLPADAARPALILFTDGKHDVKGVPVGQVAPALQRLFGARSPFALLPVGMGLASKDRAALAAGLERLRVTRDMPACVTGATFAWPQVVFDTADQAGNAVAVALQDATCTFTVAPTPTPATPVPSPTPVPVRVQDARLVAGDGRIDLAWARPVTDATSPPVVDYRSRCRTTGGGEWVESTEGVSTALAATIEGLTNGATYECEVAAVNDVGATSEPTWTTAGSAMPVGRPAAPTKPAVEALNGALRISVTPPAGQIDRFRYECSQDNGATWPEATDTAISDGTARIAGLTNGVEYVCRAFAGNNVGISDASPVSDAIRPCSSPLECTPILLPVVGGLAALLLGGIAAALFALSRGRARGYVVAVADVVHSANIGHGSVLGLSFERDPNTKRVSGIVADRGPDADVRIRHRRNGTFVVVDRVGRREVAAGDTVVVADAVGVRHSLVLRAFATNAASQVATRR